MYALQSLQGMQACAVAQAVLLHCLWQAAFSRAHPTKMCLKSVGFCSEQKLSLDSLASK